MPTIIKIDSVSKKWESFIGINDISLSVEAGEFVTLLGPSGSGKSTLLRMIGGFEKPSSGSIWLENKNITHLPPNQRDVNMVFQDYALFPHMNVEKNVGYGLRFSNASRAEIKKKTVDTLELVGLLDKSESMPNQLSGGERQRVALARALVREPKVLLLDEPLSALDDNLRKAMQVELRHLHRKLGLTFIMVTHNQDEALAMADRVLVMRSGSVVQDGTPDDLYDNPASAYVAEFIGSTNLFSSSVVDGKITLNGQALDLPKSLQDCSSGCFGFRPEKVRLATDEKKGRNRVTGTLNEIFYHGSTVQLVVLCGSNRILVSEMLKNENGHKALPKLGENISLEISPEVIMHFEEELNE